MHEKQIGAAGIVIVLSLVAGTAARADCIVYSAPNICEMSGALAEGFWIGEYTIQAGAGTFTSRAGTFGIPPAGMAPATVFQIGGDLVIQHPQRELNADLVSLDPDYPGWSWETGAGDTSLSDVELVAGCYSDDMPRWIAPTESEDGVPMTLELVAIDPLFIFGRLSTEGMREGMAFTYERHITMQRADYPVEGLEENVYSSDECELLCEGAPWLCPG